MAHHRNAVGLYGTAVVAYLVIFARSIRSSEGALLFLALGWFGISLSMDFVPHHVPGTFFLEDAFKFLGISAWSTYLARMCFLECSSPARVPAAHRVVEETRV